MVTPARIDHPKPFTTIALIVLAVIAVLQLLRFLLRWEVTLNGAVVPVWLSGVAFVVAGGLAVMVWRENRP
jgi:hypothetical protein